MTSLDIKTIIPKCDQSGEGYNPHVLEKYEKPYFVVGRYLGANRNCIIGADIYITNPNTTYILNIKVESVIEFSNDVTPTPTDIYEIYKEIKLKWRNEVFETCKEKSMPLVTIRVEPLPFQEVKDSIEIAIRQSLVQNN